VTVFLIIVVTFYPSRDL